MIRVAIIGTGAIADTHIAAYKQFSPRCQIVALVDVLPEKAYLKAQKHGLSVPVFSNCEELLESVEFDAASVCVPPFAHAEVAVALLKAGKHVLLEKPMATSLEECDAIVEAAKASGAYLSVVSQNRFKHSVMKLKRLLDSGILGKVLHAQVDSFWWRGNNYYELWWRGTWENEGGGCTINHSVHHIDILLWLIGMPVEVQAVIANLNHTNSEVEDFSTAVLFYQDGRIAQITASLIHHGEDQQLVFQTERAKVAIPWQVKAFRSRPNGFPEDDPDTVAMIQQFYDQLPLLPTEGHTAQIDNFISTIEGKDVLIVDGEQGRRTIELITAIYWAAHITAPVKLPITKECPFYTKDGILRNAKRFHKKIRSVQTLDDEHISFGRDLGR